MRTTAPSKILKRICFWMSVAIPHGIFKKYKETIGISMMPPPVIEFLRSNNYIFKKGKIFKVSEMDFFTSYNHYFSTKKWYCLITIITPPNPCLSPMSSTPSNSLQSLNNQKDVFIPTKKRDFDLRREVLIQSIKFDLKSSSLAGKGVSQTCKFYFPKNFLIT